MLEFILIIAVCFLILTFFYKQAVCEFRINQMEWTVQSLQHSESPSVIIKDLLHEKVPLVIRSIPSATFWTREDVLQRPCFSSIPVFQDSRLTDWIATATPDSICPWKYTQAETIATASGISIWAKQHMNPVIIHPFLRYWLTPRYHCWAGAKGLHRTFATWTCLFPVEGEVAVTIMPETMENYLPMPWVGCFPNQLSKKDTPFVGDLKYMDIILRPGTCLFMPAHWFVSWTSSLRDSKKVPMVCTISYHTPISLLAFNASPFTK